MDGVPALCVAAWDGVRWREMGAGVGQVAATWEQTAEGVQAFAVVDGVLHAVGRFRVGGASATPIGVVRFDGTTWVPVADGLPLSRSDAVVRTIVRHEGQLVVGGVFSLGSSTARSVVARLDRESFIELGPTQSAQVGSVRQLAVFQGSLYAGGQGLSQPLAPGSFASLLRLGAEGWSAVHPAFVSGSAFNTVRSLRVDGDRLLVGGEFGASTGGRVVALRTWDGTNVVDVATATQRGLHSVWSNASGIFGAGQFDAHVLRAENGIMQVVGEGLQGSNRPAGGFEAVNILLIGESDGTRLNLPRGLILGGTALSTDRNSVVGRRKWRYVHGLSIFDGERPHPISAGPDRPVHDLAHYNGAMAAVGSFLSAGSRRATRVALYNGVRWTPLGDGAGPDATAHAVLAWQGKLVVGGEFGSVAGMAAQRIAAWNGSNWEAMGSIAEFAVLDLWEWDGSLLAVCSNSTRIAGEGVVITLRRWDGTEWVLFGDSADDATRRVLAVFDGRLYGTLGWSLERWDGSGWQPVLANGRPTRFEGVYQGGLLVTRTDSLGGQWVHSRLDAFDQEQVLSRSQWSYANPPRAWASSTGGTVRVGGSFGNSGSGVSNVEFFNGAQHVPVAPFVRRSETAWNETVDTVCVLEFQGRVFVGGGRVWLGESRTTTPWLPMNGLMEIRDLDALPRFRATTSVEEVLPIRGAVSLGVQVEGASGATRQWYRNDVALNDGVQSDGSIVLGAQSDTLHIENLGENLSASRYRIEVGRSGDAGCVLARRGTMFAIRTPIACDSTDFDRDGRTPTEDDLVAFLTVLAGLPCPSGDETACNDIDFNNDFLYPDDQDLLDFLSALGGRVCR
jgi:hypothetical protein